MADTQTLTPSPPAEIPQGHVACPRCNGSGLVIVRTFGTPGVKKPDASRDLICCRCGGYGSVVPFSGAK